jgi:hypothetical protein
MRAVLSTQFDQSPVGAQDASEVAALALGDADACAAGRAVSVEVLVGVGVGCDGSSRVGALDDGGAGLQATSARQSEGRRARPAKIIHERYTAPSDPR